MDKIRTLCTPHSALLFLSLGSACSHVLSQSLWGSTVADAVLSCLPRKIGSSKLTISCGFSHFSIVLCCKSSQFALLPFWAIALRGDLPHKGEEHLVRGGVIVTLRVPFFRIALEFT